MYVEAWMQNNVVTLSGDIRQTALNFLEYSTRELYDKKKDATLFLTYSQYELYPHLLCLRLLHFRPHRFSRRESSIATSGTVCSAKAGGVIQARDITLPDLSCNLVAYFCSHKFWYLL